MGLIGLGNMGTAFAERLLDAGYPLVVSNRTPGKAQALAARGAVLAASPAQLVEQVDVILTSLADDDAFDAVATEVIAAARPGSVLVDLSTVSPAASARVAERAEAASVGYVRAPVSGNPSVVRAGNLSFIVSGAAAPTSIASSRPSGRSARPCTASVTESRLGPSSSRSI